MAVQIFYQYNFFNKTKELEAIKKDLVANYALRQEDKIKDYQKRIDTGLLDELLLGLALRQNAIDDDIESLLKRGWTIKVLPELVPEIIRLGAFELQFALNTPFKVIINEYVNIAGSFFDAKKVTFINGILENLAKKYRPNEVTPK